MRFISHSDLKSKHALLSPSQPYWLGYSEDKLFQKYLSTYKKWY